MTETQAASATAGLTGFAQQVGLNTNKALQDFDQLSKDYAAFGGQKLIKTFKNLAVVSKRTGVEMRTLTGIAKGFDTFEGAAGKVGQLNAILGGPYLNTLKMINTTDPNERIQILMQAMERSGKSFDKLGKDAYYMKQTLADMFNIDAGTAERLFSGQAKTIQEAQRQAQGYSGTLKGLEGQAKKNETLQEAQQRAMINMAKYTEELSGGIQKLIGFMDRGASFIKEWAGLIMGVGGAAALLTTNLGTLMTSGFVGGGGFLGKALGGLKDLVGGFKGVEGAAGAASTGIGSFAARLGMWASVAKSSMSIIGDLIGEFAPSLRHKLGIGKSSGEMSISNAIPGMQRGRDHASGMARVHGGEVLVSMPNDTNVISNENIKRQERNIFQLQKTTTSIMEVIRRPLTIQQPTPVMLQQERIPSIPSVTEVKMAQDIRQLVENTRQVSETISNTSTTREVREQSRFQSEIALMRSQPQGAGGPAGNVNVTVTPTPISIFMDGAEIYKLIESWHNTNISINNR